MKSSIKRFAESKNIPLTAKNLPTARRSTLKCLPALIEFMDQQQTQLLTGKSKLYETLFGFKNEVLVFELFDQSVVPLRDDSKPKINKVCHWPWFIWKYGYANWHNQNDMKSQ